MAKFLRDDIRTAKLENIDRVTLIEGAARVYAAVVSRNDSLFNTRTWEARDAVDDFLKHMLKDI